MNSNPVDAEINEPRKVLLVGFGSIGTLHHRVLTKLGCQVLTVSRRNGFGQFDSIEKALAQGSYSAVCIALETSEHALMLHKILAANHAGPILVEKPLFMSHQDAENIRQDHPIYVGYNLRFHPAVRLLRQWLVDNNAKVIQLSLSVGQKLSSWRPNRTTSDVYSAQLSKGGGVLRDLSHELDLAQWLVGPTRKLSALGGRFGTETIDADDAWSILMRCEQAPMVTISLNALDERSHRCIRVTSDKGEAYLDLISGQTTLGTQTSDMISARDESYLAMWREVLMQNTRSQSDLCTYAEGLQVMKTIDACEKACLTGQWIELNA